MAEPFVGQIIIAGFNFAPVDYATCDGQILSIAQNQALFALLGTTYGGNGVSTFGLPDLRGRVPIHMGQGPGLTNRTLGEVSGEENHTLTSSQMPQHTHTQQAVAGAANRRDPTGALLAEDPTLKGAYYSSTAANTTMNATAIALAGGNQPHNNLQPYVVLNYSIAIFGIFPSRN